MNRLPGRWLVPVAMLALLVVMLAATPRLTRVARAAPLAVAVPTLLLLILELAREGVPWLRHRYEVVLRFDPLGARTIRNRVVRSSKRDRAGRPDGRSPRAERQMILWVAALPSCVAASGVPFGLAAFAFLYLRFASRESIRRAAAVSACTYLVLYVLFRYVLHAPLLSGVQWPHA